MLVLVLAAGCGGTQGARPHDMSVTHHEAEASGHGAEAARHTGMYDATLRSAHERCVSVSPARTVETCWASMVNPTEEHRREAERHLQMVADHRAASQALRDAEARSCGGLGEIDRDMSPFAHREDITSVEPLTASVTSSRPALQHTVGAVVTFRAVPGMTVEWLQRVVRCHLARNAALGHDVPEMPSCLLVPRGAEASVRSTGDGFAVEIRADDPDAISEIQRRARALAPAVAPNGTSP